MMRRAWLLWGLLCLGAAAQEVPFGIFPAHLQVESTDPRTGVQTVVFSASVVNRTSEPRTANLTRLWVVDDQGRSYPPFKVRSESGGTTDPEQDLKWLPGDSLGQMHRLYYRLPRGRTIQGAILKDAAGRVLGRGW